VIVEVLTDDGVTEQVKSESAVVRREIRPFDGAIIVSDLVGGVEFRFLRLEIGDGPTNVCLAFGQPVTEFRLLGRGFTFHLDESGGGRTVWIPRAPFVAQFGPHGRIDLCRTTTTWKISDTDGGGQLTVDVDSEGESEICVTVVILPEQGLDFAQEIQIVSRLTHPTLLKSDWFEVRKPDDLWDFLINGDVYDPRPSRPTGDRFRCQQCAFSWWTYLQKLHDETSLNLFRLLARELAWSVRADFLTRGEWSHGFWCEPPETHLRFVLDGVQLMLSEGEASGESDWVVDAERVMESVILNYTDSLENDGLWFLHDSLELEDPTQVTTLTTLGATPGNTLCLNTHVQALSVLYRLRLRGGSEREELFEGAYRRGLAALERILKLHPAELLYKLLGRLVLPAVTAKNRPGVSARLRRIFVFRFLRKTYWLARQRYPRMVYPNGFIERDMSSSMLADDYHVLNLKDLLILQYQDPQDWLQPIIDRGLSFLRGMDLRLALDRSSLFVESVEVVRMGGGLSGNESTSDVDTVESIVREVARGVSLDDSCRMGGGLGLETRIR